MSPVLKEKYFPRNRCFWWPMERPLQEATNIWPSPSMKNSEERQECRGLNFHEFSPTGSHETLQYIKSYYYQFMSTDTVG